MTTLIRSTRAELLRLLRARDEITSLLVFWALRFVLWPSWWSRWGVGMRC